MTPRIPPQNIEAEQCVIGSALINNAVLDDIAIRQNEFYKTEHQEIWGAITALYQENKPADILTVMAKLKATGKLEAARGPGYIASLSDGVPVSANATRYADIVKQAAIQRKVIGAAQSLAEMAYSGADIDDMAASINGLFDADQSEESAPLSDIIKGGFKEIERRYENKNTITGVPTGLADFDKKTAGLQPADLIIIAGRPSMGKTALAMNIARHAANNVPVGVFSLEMNKSSLGSRFLSAEANVCGHNIRTGFLSDSDWGRLGKAYGALVGLPMIVDDTPALAIGEIRRRARKMHRKQGIGLLVLDYMQLVRVPGSRSREQEISEISRTLKAIAKELNIPVVALSQLNRSLEARPNKRPVLSDLRESGAIEQDADLICFIYRDEVYNKAEDNPKRGIAELIIGKQRNGPTGTVEVCFIDKTTSFKDLAPNSWGGGNG